MSDTLIYGRRFRVLNIMDDHNREALWIEAGYSMPSSAVIQALENAFREHGKPKVIRTDNGPEFCSKEFALWCENQQIKQQFIQPGKPMQNGFIERFNRSYRTEVLDAYLFSSIHQVNEITENWMTDYNNQRPHESLGHIPPTKYKNRKLIDILKTSCEVSNISTSHKHQNLVKLSTLEQS